MASLDAGCQRCCPDPFAFTRLWAVILARKRNWEKKSLEIFSHQACFPKAGRLEKVEQEGTEACRGGGGGELVRERGLPRLLQVNSQSHLGVAFLQTQILMQPTAE